MFVSSYPRLQCVVDSLSELLQLSVVEGEGGDGLVWFGLAGFGVLWFERDVDCRILKMRVRSGLPRRERRRHNDYLHE